MFVQIHMLQSMPPGNLNRDDTGQPKGQLRGSLQLPTGLPFRLPRIRRCTIPRLRSTYSVACSGDSAGRAYGFPHGT